MTTQWPFVSCCSPESEDCYCGLEERSLRAWGRGEFHKPMTADQRSWCLDEIGKVEGHKRSDHEKDSDLDLANAVLSAWTDYCRDKGLL